MRTSLASSLALLFLAMSAERSVGQEASVKPANPLGPGDHTRTIMMGEYGGGKDGAEVVLVVIEEGGHTWPGQQPPVGFIGKSVKTVSANDVMWEFFKKHPMK